MTNESGQLLRVVVDTNVLVSGLINPHGLPRQLLDVWAAERLELLTSAELIDEAVRVLHRSRIRSKYGVTSERISDLQTRLERTATSVTPTTPVPLFSRDPKDDTFLAVALAGTADYLVTGDDDLLVLNGDPALTTLQIVTVRDFLAVLSRDS
jgi:putative PIN family toxin of toxin-antitoxin system